MSNNKRERMNKVLWNYNGHYGIHTRHKRAHIVSKLISSSSDFELKMYIYLEELIVSHNRRGIADKNEILKCHKSNIKCTKVPNFIQFFTIAKKKNV